jgi:hypothetical protein
MHVSVKAHKIYFTVPELMLPGVKFTIIAVCLILVLPFMFDSNWISKCVEANVGGKSSLIKLVAVGIVLPSADLLGR